MLMGLREGKHAGDGRLMSDAPLDAHSGGSAWERAGLHWFRKALDKMNEAKVRHAPRYPRCRALQNYLGGVYTSAHTKFCKTKYQGHCF